MSQEKSYWEQGPQDWLQKDTGLTVEEFREQQHQRLRKDRPDWVGKEFDRPGGMMHKHFDEFTTQWQPGDQIWHFRSPGYSWSILAGREGYSIVREGKVIASYVTILN